MKKRALPLLTSGLLSHRNHSGSALMPPPPPFPTLEEPTDEEPKKIQHPHHHTHKKVTKISIKHPKESADDIILQTQSNTPSSSFAPSSFDDGGFTQTYQTSPYSKSIPQEQPISFPSDLSHHDSSDSSQTISLADDHSEINEAIELSKAKEKKRGFFARLFLPKKSASSIKPINFSASLENHPQTQNQTGHSPFESDLSEVDRIHSLISDARAKLLGLDIASAKQDYIEIMKSYRQMTPDEQKQVYFEIQELYEERKAAEELK